MAVVHATSGRGVAREGVTDLQRARLIAALVDVVRERGAGEVTIAHVVERAGVSRRTFYELFADREACLLAALEEAVGRMAARVRPEFEGHGNWRERIRAALGGLLGFLEDEPDLGALCLVDALGAGPRALELRAEVVSVLVDAVDGGRAEARLGTAPTRLTAECVVGAVLGVLHARLVSQRPSEAEPKAARAGLEGHLDGRSHRARPEAPLAVPALVDAPSAGSRAAAEGAPASGLVASRAAVSKLEDERSLRSRRTDTDTGTSSCSTAPAPADPTALDSKSVDSLMSLLAPLMGIVVLPYMGQAAARREASRPVPERERSAAPNRDPLRELDMRLTYRTVRTLLAIAAEPGASNRAVADVAGIADPGQISKLLTRLEHLQLIHNHSAEHPRGRPNSWTLTDKGRQVADSFRRQQTATAQS
jgi:AcrR family transcriptional regulator/DNA-binding MarR family transcriptional regulator